MKFELWEYEDGGYLIGVPRKDRGEILHEPGSRLLLRIEAESPEQATEIKERFLYDDNPDGLEALNLSGKSFLFDTYECGLKAGETVRFDCDFHLTIPGYYCGYYSQGIVADVLEGDVEAPRIIWLRIVSDPTCENKPGFVFSIPDDGCVFKYLRKVE